MNSSVQGPTDENGVSKWLRSGEFVRIQDYKVALKQITELEEQIEQLNDYLEGRNYEQN